MRRMKMKKKKFKSGEKDLKIKNVEEKNYF